MNFASVEKLINLDVRVCLLIENRSFCRHYVRLRFLVNWALRSLQYRHRLVLERNDFLFFVDSWVFLKHAAHTQGHQVLHVNCFLMFNYSIRKHPVVVSVLSHCPRLCNRTPFLNGRFYSGGGSF